MAGIGGRLGGVVCAVMLSTGGGCVSWLNGSTDHGWALDFDTAEQRVYDSGKPLLIFYRNPRHREDQVVEDALQAESVAALTERYVGCTLLTSYEPDRRYVGQYGVYRPPALIVVHPDGTYHARSAIMSADDIVSFLTQAQPPGTKPAINPHIPRRARYSWLHSVEEAEAVSRETGQPMVVVFYRSLSRDWRTLSKLLSRHEVYGRLAEALHVRIGLLNPTIETHATRFGPLKLPAMVMARPDGTFTTYERPTSYEAVVRWVDAALNKHAKEPAAAVVRSMAPVTGS